MNVLLITADQLRYDAIGTAGLGGAKTPNFDRMAKKGVFFTKAYTPCPICVPARAVITTGNYAHRATGSKSNCGLIKNDQPRIAHHFNDSGYATYAIGKLHYVPYAPPGKSRLLHGFKYCDLHESGRILREFDPEGKQRGLEDYHDYLHSVGYGGYERAHGIGNNEVCATASIVPEEHYVDTWITRRSIAMLKQHLKKQRGKPFFMWTSYPKPHSPYDPPGRWATMYDPRKVPPPAGNQKMLVDKDPLLRSLRGRFMWDAMSPEAIQASRARYWGLVSLQDHLIGQLLDFLDENGLAGNTIVIFTTDHGDLLGDFGCFFKSNHLEGSSHIPFIWRVPGIAGGKRFNALVGLEDILPTLATLTATKLAHAVQGKDITSVLRKGRPVRDMYVAQVHDAPRQSYMITDGHYKYIYHEMGPTEELYDLESDPQELKNLLSKGKAKDVAGKFKARLEAWIKEYKDKTMLNKKGRLVSRLIPDDFLKQGPNPNMWGRRMF